MFGNQASVLVGDFVYSRAFQMMAAIGVTAGHGDHGRLATNVIAEGEVLQLMNAHDPDTTEQRYLEVIYRKTAKLFEAGAEVAAVLAGVAAGGARRRWPATGATWAPPTSSSMMCSTTAPIPSERGKNLGDDLAEGKPTLPLIHALKHGNESQREAIREAIRRGGLAQLEPVIAAIEATGGLDYTLALAREQCTQAQAALQGLPESPYKTGLAELARFAVEHTT